METRLNLQLGQNGTKALVKKYGKQLVCVRYRYNASRGKRYKTVELIEEARPWRPAGSREAHLMQRAADEPVLLRIDYKGIYLRASLRRQGGKWCREEKAWRVTFGVANELGLTDRIVGDI